MNYKQITMNGKVVKLINGKQPNLVTVNGTVYEPVATSEPLYSHTIHMTRIVSHYAISGTATSYADFTFVNNEPEAYTLQTFFSESENLLFDKVVASGRWYTVKSGTTSYYYDYSTFNRAEKIVYSQLRLSSINTMSGQETFVANWVSTANSFTDTVTPVS